MLLAGKACIVSGVGPNIGRSIALTLARAGADLALAARREENLRSVATEVEALGRRAICVATDITDPEQCRRLAAETQGAFGRIDVLVNNAAFGGPVGLFAESDLQTWRTGMEVNLWGSLNMTQAVVPAMREQGDGRVIMLNSGRPEAWVSAAVPGFGPYRASKAALRVMCQVLANELGPLGIRVDTVVPNVTGDAEWLEQRWSPEAERRGMTTQALLDEIATKRPLGFIPSPDDIADAVLFFASDLSRAATGQYLHVDGGVFFG